MDIRTKLVFALVAVALGSMLALGAVLYAGADEDLREARLAMLDGLAEAKKESLQEVVRGWRDRVRLVANRTQMRESLRSWNQTGDPQAARRIEEILDDALGTVGLLDALGVYGTDGVLVAAATQSPGAPQPPPRTQPPEDPAVVLHEGTSFAGGDLPTIHFLTALELDGVPIGALRVRVSGSALRNIVEDRTALGATGAVMIVVADEDDSAHVIHPTLPETAEGEASPIPEGEVDVVELALAGEEGRHWRGVRDGQGHPVWASIRRVPATGWGVVVKMDAVEARAPAMAFRRQVTRLSVALAAFAILIGTVLGLRFAKPIHDLAEVAERIRKGELGARAEVASEDEVGLLARTFNQMAGELEDRMTQLREFEMFFEVSLDMLCIAGTDGYFKRVNDAFERNLGWSSEELLSRPITDFVHPDDVERTAREISRLAEGIPTVSFENRWRRPDGSYRHLQWTSHPEPETGLLYSAARDVTELAKTREALRELRQRLGETEESRGGGSGDP